MFVAILLTVSWTGVAQKPNVIFILADDLGWGDLQCYGNPYVETPALNKLAAEGIRFTDYYSPSPLCAPARAAILTGRYNHRTGATDVSSNRGIDRIALSERTMGDYFKHAGYATALIGKWHNGLYSNPFLPHNRGFDFYFGFPNGGQDYYEWNLMRNGVNEAHDGRYLTDVLNEEAIRFIDGHKDQPFFLLLAHHAPHMPFQAPDSLIEKYVRRIDGAHRREVAIIYAMIEVMDRGIGRIIEKLDELKIRENTLIVFTSDNGASYIDRKNPRFHGPYSGEKGNVLEQGIRVPAIVSWKGTISQNKVVSEPVHGCDWLPTAFGLTGAKAPEGAKPLDGWDIMPLLKNLEMPSLSDRPFLFQKTRYVPVAHSDGSVRKGPWKLYWPMVDETMKKDIARDNPSYQKGLINPHWEMPLDVQLPVYATMGSEKPRLFNLVEDPSERNDLAAARPEIVKELSAIYDGWFADISVDWQKSWEEIKAQDISYWKGRRVPDPLKLFDGFWLWDRVNADPATSDPLKVFPGYWSAVEKPRKGTVNRKR